MNSSDLLNIAKNASQMAYAPYSNFHVGAAVLGDDGQVYTGINVENRSFGLTVCAERNAIAKGISMGMKKIAAIAIYSPDAGEILYPCGACRQVISEFATDTTKIICTSDDKIIREYTIAQLYPGDSLRDLCNKQI